jgi:hypothetical protein
LGIVFEEESKTGRAVVAEVVPGSNAEQLRKRAALDPALAASAPKEGDVLRAVTCTNIVYQTGALLFGAQTPKRALVVFGADGQRWPNVAAALQKGLAADGNVTLVLERRRGTLQEWEVLSNTKLWLTLSVWEFRRAKAIVCSFRSLHSLISGLILARILLSPASSKLLDPSLDIEGSWLPAEINTCNSITVSRRQGCDVYPRYTSERAYLCWNEGSHKPSCCDRWIAAM